ncbi:MAG: nitronate monooxygenase [Dehalococcoidia bacterium]|nr:nitronate monooxygenase [Dehalococcoidia bacterium]
MCECCSLRTELTERLGIEHPIIQAGMSAEGGPALATAVSGAGALGTIGSIGAGPDVLEQQIKRCRDLTDKPFSVNVVTFDWAPFGQQLLEVAIEQQVPIVTLSFGNPLPSLERCRAAGVKTLVQVQDLESARAILHAAPDALIVQGNEAGGHTGRRGTLNFAAQVLDLAGNIPVVLAGGVGNGRGLAAALAMGAAGVVMGTRFKASEEFADGGPPESAAVLRWQKDAIVASDGSNTLYDEILDNAYGLAWPNQVTGRALRNRFTQEWEGRHEELRQKVAAEPPFAFVQGLARSPETAINWAGESSGLVDEIKPAAQIVAETVQQAEQLLGQVAARTGSAPA